MWVLDKAAAMGRSAWYWLAFVALSLSMEGVALFYQYGLDFGPCVLCIHVRIWLTGAIAVGLLAVWARNYWIPRVVVHLLATGVMLGILERAWQLLGTERGTIFGSCKMSLGLPAWLALDEWFPRVYGVWESCGNTPELLFGITMAEALVGFGVVMSLLSAGLTLTALLSRWVVDD